MSEFDVKVMYIEDDLKKVQTKTNLYIQNYGDKGVFHLYKEMAQNSIDEDEDPALSKYLKSIGEDKKKRIIKTTYDHLSDKVTVEDWGRGIPEEQYEIDVVCTKLQSGSKFWRDQGGNSSGEFGVGLTVVNALSSEFSIATYRGTYFHRITFKDGVKVEDVKEKIKKNGKTHGTITSFIVNPQYLGKGSKFPMDLCIEWLELMSYQVQENIEFVVEEYEGLSHVKTTKIKKKPFSDLIKRYIPNEKELPFAPISLSGKGSIEEEITRNVMTEKGTVKAKTSKAKKQIKLEFAFAYNQEEMVPEYDSFCNFTNTEEGGIHVDAVEDAVCKFLQQKTKDDMSDAAKAKMDITRADVKAGLVMVVNLSTNAQVQFMGNAKNKIQNEELKPVLREIASKLLEDYFVEEPGKLSACIKTIKQNAKARIEMQKAKSVTIKKRVDNFSEYEIHNFIKANNTGNKYRELFLIEGRRSAAGSMVDGRDPNTQAIFGFRGVTANPFKCTLAQIMENEEWRNYVKVLRCGIGNNFNLDHLYYDKIIISTDADIDGFGISSGIAAFHVKHLPEIVEAGRLYKVYPPLYRIQDSSKPFITNKGERVEIYMKKIVKNYKIRIIEAVNSEYLNKTELWEFLFDNVDYRDNLRFLYDFYKVDSLLLEAIAASLVKYKAIDTSGTKPKLIESRLKDKDFIRDFSKEIQEKFPEVHLEKDYVKGVVNGGVKSVRINQRFVKKIEDIIPIYEKYSYQIGVKEKDSEEREMTILEFLNDTYHLIPEIITRFKGLGEADPEQLWETTLNPENRILVRLTFDNIERDMEIFNKLKSDKLIYQQQRKKMMEEFKIRREDLDT